MQINIKGHHVEITDSMQDYINSKFQKLERFFEHINNVHVVLRVEKSAPYRRSNTTCQPRRYPCDSRRREHVCCDRLFSR